MKNVKFLALLLGFVFISATAQADKRDFSLTNATGYDIKSVFVDS